LQSNALLKDTEPMSGEYLIQHMIEVFECIFMFALRGPRQCAVIIRSPVLYVIALHPERFLDIGHCAVVLPQRSVRLRAFEQSARLTFDGDEVMLTEQRPNVAIGRADDNDLVIRGNLISRLHARIEINRNKFVLIDQSTNGTFVQAEGGEELFVRRDSVQIKGEGLIGLGRVPERDSPLTIRFYCEEA